MTWNPYTRAEETCCYRCERETPELYVATERDDGTRYERHDGSFGASDLYLCQDCLVEYLNERASAMTRQQREALKIQRRIPMHRDYYDDDTDRDFHADPAHDGRPCPQAEAEGLDSYLGTLCQAHYAEQDNLFTDAAYVECDNPFCHAECCVCVADR